MPDQPDDTRATAYVDDGETLHGVGLCGACVFCGARTSLNLTLAEGKRSGLSLCYRHWLEKGESGERQYAEYDRRVANQFAKIFPSLREEPKVERAEEPWERQADGRAAITRFVARLTQGHYAPSTLEANSLLDELKALWLDRHTSHPEPTNAGRILASVQGEGKAVEASGGTPRSAAVDSLYVAAAVAQLALSSLGPPRQRALGQREAFRLLTSALIALESADRQMSERLRGAIGEAFEPVDKELEGAIRAALAVEQDRDRLRHSANEQQVEIARLREELGKVRAVLLAENVESVGALAVARGELRKELGEAQSKITGLIDRADAPTYQALRAKLNDERIRVGHQNFDVGDVMPIVAGFMEQRDAANTKACRDLDAALGELAKAQERMSGRVTCTVCLGESAAWYLKLESALADKSEALLEQASDANRLERELARATVVVERAAWWVAAELAASGGAHKSKLYESLLESGFIDREGKRTK